MPKDDDDDDDLFGDSSDSDDTAELISNSKPVGKKKKAVTKKQPKKNARTPKEKAKAADSDDDLFDSDDSDDDDEDDDKKKKAAPPAKPLSKRERLEALAASKKRAAAPAAQPATAAGENNKESGYDSGDSYDSVNIQRTADDDAFIDTTGEDAAVVQEYYAEQHFDDLRPDDEDEVKKKKKKHRHRRNDDHDDDGPPPEPDNPVLAAVQRMKKKKRPKASLAELESVAAQFVGKMTHAADEDDRNGNGLKKLQLLPFVKEGVAQVDTQRSLLEHDVLAVFKRWLHPLSNGKLGNVTIRQTCGECLERLTPHIQPQDLKRSGLGRTIMILYQHRDETATLKRHWKKLIEQWSRPIFQKSGNMKDWDQRNAIVRPTSLSPERPKKRKKQRTQAELNALIATGKKEATDEGEAKRVRVPFSKGFQYSVRPENRHLSDLSTPPREATSSTASRLSKRMVEKGRTVAKNQRSANISIEGRAAK